MGRTISLLCCSVDVRMENSSMLPEGFDKVGGKKSTFTASIGIKSTSTSQVLIKCT